MPLVVALGWRSLRSRPLRSTLTVAGIALAVAMLAAGLATNAAIDGSIQKTVRDRLGQSDLRVEPVQEDGLRPATVQAIAGRAGVAVAAPAIDRRAYLASGSPTDASALPEPVSVVGVDPGREVLLHDLSVVAGTGQLTPGQPTALVTAPLAATEHLVPGTSVSVRGPNGSTPFRVVGILARDSSSSRSDGRSVVVALDQALALFGVDGVDRVDIGIAEGVDPQAVTADLEGALRTQPYAIVTPAEIASGLRGSIGAVATLATLLAALGLFGGAFLIDSTLSMTVVERVREVGLLRVAGATRRQVAAVVAIQALALGVTGSVVGVVLGVIVSAAVEGATSSIGSFTLVPSGVRVGPTLGALLVGMSITLAAALEPAWRASRIVPAATSSPGGLAAGQRIPFVGALAVVGLVALVGLAIAPTVGSGSNVVGIVAVAVAMLALIVVVPVAVGPVTRIAGLPFRGVLHVEERLARGALLRNRARSGWLLGAVAVGLGATVALGAVGQVARASAARWLADVVPGDAVLTSIRPIGPNEGYVPSLGRSPGVRSVTPMATFQIVLDGVRTPALAVVGSDLASDGRLPAFLDGDRVAALAALDRGGSVVLPAAVAARWGARVGSTIHAGTHDGSALPLTVAGIVSRTIPGTGDDAVLVGWPDATGHLGVAGADAFAVRFDATAPVTARQDLAEAARELELESVPLVGIQAAVDVALGRALGVLDGLALVVVLLASLAIVNTLTINVLERVREIGVLRSAGMTRRQVWRMVVVEAGIVGLGGAALGAMGGVGIAALAIGSAGGRVDLVGLVPWPVTTVAVVLGVVIAMLAAMYPARMASRLPIAEAVRAE
ncbi:MAG: FtsX-like permease family protein [Chloroflexota bacterium]